MSTSTCARTICNFHVYWRITGVGKFHSYQMPKCNSSVSQADRCVHASQQNHESTASDIKTKRRKDCLPFALYWTDLKLGFLLFSFSGRMLGVLKHQVWKEIPTTRCFTMQHVPWRRDDWNSQSKITRLLCHYGLNDKPILPGSLTQVCTVENISAILETRTSFHKVATQYWVSIRIEVIISTH